MGVLTCSSAFQKEIPSAAMSVAEALAESGKRSVAVVDFTDLRGDVTELGRFVAEELALGLVTAKKNFSVVDRTHLRAILQENKLGSSGLIDPATARKLGQITGVEALVTGSMTVLGDRVHLVIKVLDTLINLAIDLDAAAGHWLSHQAVLPAKRNGTE
ncbi:MAG: CsgG/HfaB family protein [Acidobacteriia bacterium]|nr:CsgG/HfaB family protein [Terriglobia bacterium]